MDIRRLTSEDLRGLAEIDGTIDSSEYLHITRGGEALALNFAIELRPLRERTIQPNRLNDEISFLAKQIASGADEGFALVAEHNGGIVAMLLAQTDSARAVLTILDVRVDHDFRRQGVGMALIYQAIQFARDAELRAVAIQSKTDNLPIARLLQKCGFEIAGLDIHHQTNHDLVAESVTLFWYAAFH
jgi:GNAT superfamily N-acetyltransferase